MTQLEKTEKQMPNYKIERDPDTLRNSRHGGTPPDEKDRTQH